MPQNQQKKNILVTFRHLKIRERREKRNKKGGEYCHLCQRRKHFYAKVNITILKFELIHLVESLQEVTDSNILLLNFDMSIIFGQNSYYFFYEFEKALIYFLCFGS